MIKGYFITIEGGEGAGKTSLITRLANTLQKKGMNVVTTREPGGIPIAEKIRTVILDTEHTMMDARTEALLYAASRRQHLVEKVIPALEEGKIVICDRFVDSSLAYQGYARGLGMDAVWGINEFAIGDMMPMLTIFMDVSPEVGLARISQAADREINRLDLERHSFHERVREGYKLLLSKFPERIELVDAEAEREDVFQAVLAIVERRLKQ
ncbi:dTMP kinase [Paenibacillus sp. L3-i20]|uniref:dTMP kinase n=1 Tax=Paenibacillus sp. L3-i20 TaxID=2905833 RepID=UPI001EE14D75|nr:dTMP kinase [Paenibacillus sp. L3-i20]GKU77117.1 thymidylate kinase [Paenibacillus sp. L3-i20]